jgi:DNA polymerase III sliding clamp (beta) subunit (PCNA family)
MKIQTVKLQSLLNKAVKGAGNNSLIPITQMIELELKDKVLTLTTTDASNYLYIIEDNVEGEDFHAVLDVALFNQIVSKFTSEYTKVTVTPTTVELVANGSYILNLQTDESGVVVAFPKKFNNIDTTNSKSYKLDTSIIPQILSTSKSALATSLEVPVYTSYYVKDKIISTNTIVICELDKKITEEPVLISRQFMDLLSVIDDLDFTFMLVDNLVCVTSKGVSIWGPVMFGLEDFPIEPVSNLLGETYRSRCTVNKNQLLSLLDRIKLFVSTYDDNTVKLDFSTQDLIVHSMRSNGVESIDYIDDKSKRAVFSCMINVVMFITQLKEMPGDKVVIEYGQDNAIKLVADDVIEVLALANIPE